MANGKHQDEEQAVDLFRKVIEHGDAKAQFNLGVMYRYGRGVEQDDAQAVYWYRKAAEQGSSDAQFNMGWRYAKGHGVKQDDSQAIYWYRKAAGQGHVNAQVNAQVNYDVMIHKNSDAKQDDLHSVDWYRKAAEQGDLLAQISLGLKYYKGEGVTQDYVMAHMWSNIAGANGKTNAGKLRDAIAEKMTPSQIEEAQKLAREWMVEHKEV